MIKVNGPIKINIKADGTTEVTTSLFSDTKAEVLNSITGGDVDGLGDEDVIGMGSSVMTASGEMAFRKSDGTWNWL